MDYFFLVPKIVGSVKYLDISLNEIERLLHEGHGEFDEDFEHTVKDDFNNEITVTLKLNIAIRRTLMVGWSIALKMHRERIDGIIGTMFTSIHAAANNTVGIGMNLIKICDLQTIAECQQK